MSNSTAGINRSNTAARAVLKQPCSTGVRTDTVRPKREPTGRTDLSDRSRLVLCNRSQELIGQACPTRRQVLWSDSACPTTGRTVPVRPPVEHGCLITARTAVFNRLMPAVQRYKLSVGADFGQIFSWLLPCLAAA
ncbi:hypothetical protein PCASD_09020 [Puccinia coronata f. sp. avenae]|uniref:Uncharacterized protein n=1 Tax=Puccinia coronata f. sp. avenae TaxID=200324 RepID=A0A2N5UL23_9BASI|nr:hypothetical protein PCASD_09020 [Puccinia coronata f. sp. avenae]